MNTDRNRPVWKNETVLIRRLQAEDCDDLRNVYSDKPALQFFNSAVDRIKAIQRAGFHKSPHLLTGKTGCAYDGYWTVQ